MVNERLRDNMVSSVYLHGLHLDTHVRPVPVWQRLARDGLNARRQGPASAEALRVEELVWAVDELPREHSRHHCLRAQLRELDDSCLERLGLGHIGVTADKEMKHALIVHDAICFVNYKCQLPYDLKRGERREEGNGGGIQNKGVRR